MKKLLLVACMFIFMGSINAQWTSVTIPNTNTDISNLTSLLDTVYAGFKGDGIFKTTDLGSTWTNVNGDLTEKNINKIIPGGGTILFVGTENGPFITFDQLTYNDNTSTGLTNTDVTHYWIGGDNDDNDFTVGTDGGGFYYGAEFSGPWTAANNGLTGDALQITSFGGYSDGADTYYMLGTKGGVYFSNDEFASWMDGNNGLSGDQLHVTGAALLGTLAIITTEGGAFYSVDYGQNWVVIFDEIKFNQLLMYPGGAGLNIWLFGEESYYSSDLQNWTSFGTPGEVICGATTTNDVFIATEDSKDAATLYRQPIDWIITDIDETIENNNTIIISSYPNPFSSKTTLKVDASEKCFVDIDITDILGKKVLSIFRGSLDAGISEFQVTGNDLKPGVYSIRLVSKNKLFQKVIMKK